MEVLVTEPYSVTSHLLHKLSTSSRQRCSLRTDYSQSAIYMKKTRMAASEPLNSIIQLSQYYEERRPLLFTSQSSSPQLTVTSQTPVLDSLLKDTCFSCYVHEEQFFLRSLIACSHSRGDSHPRRCARLTSSAPVFSLSCSHAPLSFIPSLITVIQCFISDALALASYIKKESRVHEEPTLSLLPQHGVSDTFVLHTHSKCPGENWAAVTTFQVIAQALHLISKARAAHPKGHIAKN